MSRPKIALIGGGQVGGNIALLSAQKELGDIVIVDIPEAENFMKGKALDIAQSTSVEGFDVNLMGTSNYDDTRNSDVIIIMFIKFGGLRLLVAIEFLKSSYYD